MRLFAADAGILKGSMQGKTILFVITKSSWGGAQAYVYTLATALADRGAHVAVALGGTGIKGAPLGRLAEELAKAKIEIIPIASFARDISLGDEGRALIELSRVIKKVKPDIVHVNSSKAGGLGTLAARMQGVKKIIFTAHGWPHNEPGSPLRKLFVWLASWMTVALSDRVIVVSKADKQSSLGKSAKVVHIPLGLAPFEMKSKSEARAALGIPEQETVIGTIAELTKNKGLADGIKAFSHLRQQKVADRYVIIGDGELRNTLGTEEGVQFAGFLPDARSYLRAFDVFLLPSLKEGLPYVVLEAQMAGVPVVATNVGGIPDVVPEHALVPTHSPEAIAERVIALKRSAPSANTFSLSEMLEQTITLYA